MTKHQTRVGIATDHGGFGLKQELDPRLRDAGCEVVLDVAATKIDRTARSVTLSDGRALPYDKLLLATGTRVRRNKRLAAKAKTTSPPSNAKRSVTLMACGNRLF